MAKKNKPNKYLVHGIALALSLLMLSVGFVSGKAITNGITIFVTIALGIGAIILGIKLKKKIGWAPMQMGLGLLISAISQVI